MNYELRIMGILNNKRKYLFVLASCFMILASISFAQSASAQAPTPKGITVFPSIAHIDLSTDASEYDLTYINNTKVDITLELSAQNFTELEDSYKMTFLEGKDAANYKYSLSSWLSFENKSLQLSPNEKKSVKIFIDKNRITKGGHYASILAEVKQPENKELVDVKAVLSSLLFVRSATGQEEEIGKINTFRPERKFLDFPKSFVLRFENSGNVQVIPYGLIQILDGKGNEVTRGILNEGSLDTLPETIRRYDILLKNQSKLLLPGRYSAKISMHFGKSNQKLEAQTQFYSTGSLGVAKLAIIIAIMLISTIIIRRKVKPRSINDSSSNMKLENNQTETRKFKQNKSSTFSHGVLNSRGKNTNNYPHSELRGFQKVLDKGEKKSSKP